MQRVLPHESVLQVVELPRLSRILVLPHESVLMVELYPLLLPVPVHRVLPHESVLQVIPASDDFGTAISKAKNVNATNIAAINVFIEGILYN